MLRQVVEEIVSQNLAYACQKYDVDVFAFEYAIHISAVAMQFVGEPRYIATLWHFVEDFFDTMADFHGFRARFVHSQL